MKDEPLSERSAADPDAPSVAKLLVEIGQRLVLAGENPYKARSYARAAESLLLLTLPLDDVIAQGRLQDIPGVGAALSETITRLHQHGTTPRLKAMRAEVPAGVLELLAIPGLRAPKVLELYQKLGITTLDELEAACRNDQLKSAKGFGPSFQEKVVAGIDLMRRSAGQRLLHHAADHLAQVEMNLTRSHPELSRIQPAGDFRRGLELVADLSLVAETPRGSGIEVLVMADRTKLWLADPRRYGPALVLATGSFEHVRELQARAQSQGFRLDERGLFQGRRLIPCPEEEDVYTALGLPFIEPELREGRGRSPTRQRRACLTS
jgi:DNA polymerase (family X)